MVRTIRRLVGQTWRPDAAGFTHGRPADLTTHRRVLGVAPLFDQEYDGLLIPAKDLDTPIADADPVAAVRVQRFLELEPGLSRVDEVAPVRDLIVALLPLGRCSVDRVAAHLGVSRRTLHRRLAQAEGPTFSRLLNDARVEMARRHLAAGRLSYTEIADRLGYGSLSAFSRWKRAAGLGDTDGGGRRPGADQSG